MSQAQQTRGSTEKAVTALENQWLQSQKTNNPDLVAPLMADKFVSTDSDGKFMNKAQALADAKATKWTSAEYENVHVTQLLHAAWCRATRRLASRILCAALALSVVSPVLQRP